MNVPHPVESRILKKIVRLALEEDRAANDITTNSLLPFDRVVEAQIIAKQEGIISGITACLETFSTVDPGIETRIFKDDGTEVRRGHIVVQISGKQSSILKAERTALNFLQRLSGVATFTRMFVEKVKSDGVAILDTRKTTPGMRYLEKKAVRDGGGKNHRLNLEDMAMVKDNHIQMAGSITQAVREIKKKFPGKKIEVEVKNLKEFSEAAAMDIDIIMLDNFPPDMVKKAVRLNSRGIKLEVSGNITLENIKSRIYPGIDFISVGALTHSFQSLDLSLEILRDKFQRGDSHG